MENFLFIYFFSFFHFLSFEMMFFLFDLNFFLLFFSRRTGIFVFFFSPFFINFDLCYSHSQGLTWFFICFSWLFFTFIIPSPRFCSPAALRVFTSFLITISYFLMHNASVLQLGMCLFTLLKSAQEAISHDQRKSKETA